MLDMPSGPQVGRGGNKPMSKHWYLLVTIPAVVLAGYVLMKAIYDTPMAEAAAHADTALHGQPEEAVAALNALIRTRTMPAWEQIAQVVNSPVSDIKRHITLTLETEKESYAAGERVRLRFVMQNDMDRNFVFSNYSPLSLFVKANGDMKLRQPTLQWAGIADTGVEPLHRTSAEMGKSLIVVPPGGRLVTSWFSAQSGDATQIDVTANQIFDVINPEQPDSSLEPLTGVFEIRETIRLGD